MKKRSIFLALTILSFAFIVKAQDARPKITDYINKEIYVEDSFAGQSFTLKKENNNYYILRNYLGSGIPVIGSRKYKVRFESKYQIEFSELFEQTKDDTIISPIEHFNLSVEEKDLGLYLNGLKLTIWNIDDDNKFLKPNKPH